MTPNLIDVTATGSICIREIVGGQFHRRVVDSTMDLSNEDQIVQDIAAKVPFNDSVPEDGEHKYIKTARLDPATGDMVLTPATMTVLNGEIVSIVNHPAYAVDILDDETTDSNVVEIKKIVHTRPRKTRERARRKARKAEIEANRAIQYETEDKPFVDYEDQGDKVVRVTGTRKRFKTRLVPIFEADGITPVLGEDNVQLTTRVKVRKVS